jgi:hypothetical protein
MFTRHIYWSEEHEAWAAECTEIGIRAFESSPSKALRLLETAMLEALEKAAKSQMRKENETDEDLQ